MVAFILELQEILINVGCNIKKGILNPAIPIREDL